MTWTRFMDMHSGGGLKEPQQYILIEAPEDEAKVIFYNRFGHNPERVTCTCCGEDYNIGEHSTLEAATAFDRGCDYVYFRPDGSECPQDEAWTTGRGLADGYTQGYMERPARRYAFNKFTTLEDYLKKPEVLVIHASEIKPEERVGAVPVQGYVWRN